MRKTIVTSEVIVLGRQGEDQANKVLFPVRGWKELYGDGQFVVTALRPDENDPYPVTTHIYEENDGSPIARRGVFVEWIVGSADVEIPGRGKVELAYYTSDDVRVKSVVYHTVIYDALGQNSLTPPEPWESWVDDVLEAGADAIQAAEDAAEDAQRAEDAADLAEDYADAAEGAVSTAFGQITATATTLSPGSSATASFDPSTKVMSFGIPRGQDGGGGGGGGTTVETVYIADEWEYTGSNVWVNVGYTGRCNLEEIVRKSTDEGIDRVKFCYFKNDPNEGEETTYYCDGFIQYASDSNVVIDSFLIVGMTVSSHFTVEFTGDTSVVVSRVDTPLEKRGTIGVGSLNYAVQRKPLAITENGVTTTYYVADITNT